MQLPTPNRQQLTQHPCKDDYQRILSNAFELAKEIEVQFQGHMPFGVALTKSDEITFIGYQGGQLPTGLLEHIEAQLVNMKPVLKACARCTRVDIRMEGGQRMSALQVQLEHLNGVALQAYQPIQGSERWWVEEGFNRVFSQDDKS